jgi:hypothetical protein
MKHLLLQTHCIPDLNVKAVFFEFWLFTIAQTKHEGQKLPSDPNTSSRS